MGEYEIGKNIQRIEQIIEVLSERITAIEQYLEPEEKQQKDER